MSLTLGARYWADRTAGNRRRTFNALKKGQHTADAVVIGGGLTGAAAAYALTQAGAKVMLLEAGRVAGGQTAGGIGAIIPELDPSFRGVEEMRGRRIGKPAWEEVRRSGPEFATALKKLAIKCDLEATEVVMNASTAESVAELKREHTARKAAGLASSWGAGISVRRDLGTESDGALRFHGAATYDPVRAALGLISAAEAKGAAIFEKTAVAKTRFTRKYADVIIDPSTRIRTTAIVVATSDPGTAFHQLRRHVRYHDGYLVVTEPMNAAMRREVGQRESVLTDNVGSSHFLRWLTDDRALFAGAMQPAVIPRLRDRALIQRTGQLMYELSLRYPIVSGIQPAWSWTTPVVTTMDGLPWIGAHRNYPFHFFAMALGWHGDALSWFAAKAAARHFFGEPKKEDDTFGFLRAL